MEKSIRIVHVTDTHFFANSDGRLLGLNTQESFTAVLEAIKNNIQHYDLLIHTGDISQDYTGVSYQRLAQQLDELTMPVYWTAGNHDDMAMLLQHFTAKNIHADKAILVNNWQIILLNSQMPGAVPGTLSKAELDFLADCLSKHPHHHALICFHHQPLSTGSTWLDKLGLLNAKDFFTVIDQFPQIRCVLFGHVHQEFRSERKNVIYLSTPATSVQFKPGQEQFALDVTFPGFRMLTLNPDGSINTKVYRADHFVNYKEADQNATGY